MTRDLREPRAHTSVFALAPGSCERARGRAWDRAVEEIRYSNPYINQKYTKCTMRGAARGVRAVREGEAAHPRRREVRQRGRAHLDIGAIVRLRSLLKRAPSPPRARAALDTRAADRTARRRGPPLERFRGRPARSFAALRARPRGPCRTRPPPRPSVRAAASIHAAR